MPDDDKTQNTPYLGGFTFGTQGAGQGQAQGQAKPPVQQPQPVMPAPAVAPKPVSPTSVMPQAPLAGIMDAPLPPGGASDQSAPPFDPNYVFAGRMKQFKTSIKLPPHQLKFDEDRFLNLLAGSISLTRDEKKRIVDSIPKLRQEQVDELIRIFEEERAKFIELSPKHGAQLKKLEDEHAADWRDLEIGYKQETKTQEDQSKADEIRKQLGL